MPIQRQLVLTKHSNTHTDASGEVWGLVSLDCGYQNEKTKGSNHEPSTELKTSEKATNGQRNILKELEKGWKIIAHDHFQKPTIKSDSLEEKY